jgi:hypothetical protein
MFAGMRFELRVIYSKKPSYVSHVRAFSLRVLDDSLWAAEDSGVKTVGGWTYSSFISGYEMTFHISDWDVIPGRLSRSCAALQDHVTGLSVISEGFASSVVEMMWQAFEWDRRYLLSNLMHYQMFTTSAGLVRNSSYRSVHFGYHSSFTTRIADSLVMSDQDLPFMIIDSPKGPVEISGSVKSLMVCRPMIDVDLMRMLEES